MLPNRSSWTVELAGIKDGNSEVWMEGVSPCYTRNLFNIASLDCNIPHLRAPHRMECDEKQRLLYLFFEIYAPLHLE